MKKAILLLGCVLISTGYLLAQQDIFKKYGHKKEILTLSKGKYQEVFKNSEVVQIGTVLLNTKTNKVMKLLQEDTTKTSYKSEFSSRFLTIDPLAEKFPWQSPYAFCNNNPINFIDKNGKEGTRTTDKDGNKVIESNVIVLVEQKKEIPKNATEKQIAKIEKQNAKIEKRNAERVETVTNQLNQTYNGADGKGSKNSAGETVLFKFNVTAMATNNTTGGASRDITQLALANGLPTSDPLNNTAAAAVVTTRSTGGAVGLSNGVWVTESAGAPAYTIPHEIGHTFHLVDNFPNSNGGLMDYPPGPLQPVDVDAIWNNAYDK